MTTFVIATRGSPLALWQAEQVAARLQQYADLGADTFILSGYPHAAECDLFARHVLPHIDHGRLEFEPDPVVVG